MVAKHQEWLPLPGYCLVEVMGRMAGPELRGGIVVPQKFQQLRHIVGRIRAVSMRPRDRQAMGVDLQPGQYVVLADFRGVRIEGDLYRFPLAWRHPQDGSEQWGVIALTSDPSAFGLAPTDLRCKWCGPATPEVSQGMLLDRHGVCPRCRRDATGARHGKHPEVTADDRDVASLREHMARHRGELRASPTVYSLPPAP